YDFRIMHDCLSQFEALFHPSRIGIDFAIPLLAHADKVEHLMRPLARHLKWQPAQLRAVGHILAAHHPWNVAILLRRIANALADFTALAPDLPSQQLSRAGSDWLQLEQTLHEGALACAIGTQQPDSSGRYLQIDAIQCSLLAKKFG